MEVVELPKKVNEEVIKKLEVKINREDLPNKSENEMKIVSTTVSTTPQLSKKVANKEVQKAEKPTSSKEVPCAIMNVQTRALYVQERSRERQKKKNLL